MVLSELCIRRPVMTVLRQLGEQGLVERRPGNGWSFAADASRILNESYAYRRALEPQILLQPGFKLDRAWAEKTRALTTFLVTGQTVTLTNLRHDKYGGRILGDVRLADGRDLAATLINANLARSYDGGARQGWCG